MKQTIIIIIIVASLAGAGVFTYLTFFSGTPDSITTTQGSASGSNSAPSDILPLGSNLKFDDIKTFNKDKRVFEYPTVIQSDLNPGLANIIKQ